VFGGLGKFACVRSEVVVKRHGCYLLDQHCPRMGL